MLYERRHLAILKSRMSEPRRRIQIIMGPRQVGKSTLVGQYVDSIDIPYDFFAADGVNREDNTWIPARWQEARMKMDLHRESERILIIDEVQKISSWSEQVKKEWDTDTREKRNLKVILLGSSRVLLQKGLEESLEGRFESIKMGYWDWDEMHNAFGFTMQQYIYFGGFPGLAPDIKEEDRWRNLMEDTIISPILTRDILEIDEIRNPAVPHFLIPDASIQLGQLFLRLLVLSGKLIVLLDVLHLILRLFGIPVDQGLQPVCEKVPFNLQVCTLLFQFLCPADKGLQFTEVGDDLVPVN